MNEVERNLMIERIIDHMRQDSMRNLLIDDKDEENFGFRLSPNLSDEIIETRLEEAIEKGYQIYCIKAFSLAPEEFPIEFMNDEEIEKYYRFQLWWYDNEGYAHEDRKLPEV